MYKPRMARPPHPGEILFEECISPLGLSITEAAEALGVSRKTLSEIVNCNAGISIEMAFRLSIAFNTSPEMWLNLQQAYDLAQAAKRIRKLKVKRLAASSVPI